MITKEIKETDRYCLSRAIEGISLNGYEYLLDDNNEIMWFEDDIDAYMFCYDNLGIDLPNPYEEKTCYISVLEDIGIDIRHRSEVLKDNE